MVASLLVTLVVVTAGCGGSSDTEDLRLSLRETRTAVRSTELALDLLEQGRTTRAAAQVTAGDMVDQIGLAQQRLVDAPGDTEQLRALRRRCQVVVTDSLVAVQDTEDALAAAGGGGPVRCRAAPGAERRRPGPGGGGGAVKRLFAVALGILTAIGGLKEREVPVEISSSLSYIALRGFL